MGAINGFILTAVLSVIAGILACFAGRETGKKLALTEKGGLKENLGFFKTVQAIVNLLKLIPYILILLLLYLLLRGKINISLIIAISVFIELLPMFALSTKRALGKVSQSVMDAAAAMGSDPDEIMKFFVFPEARDEIGRKTKRLLFYGFLSALAARAFINLI